MLFLLTFYCLAPKMIPNFNMSHGKKESGMFVESHVTATYQDSYNVEVPG